MKKLVFRKGVKTIIVPILLSDITPWQDQINNEIKKIKKSYLFRKDAKFDFEITSCGSNIKLTIK